MPTQHRTPREFGAASFPRREIPSMGFPRFPSRRNSLTTARKIYSLFCIQLVVKIGRPSSGRQKFRKACLLCNKNSRVRTRLHTKARTSPPSPKNEPSLPCSWHTAGQYDVPVAITVRSSFSSSICYICQLFQLFVLHTGMCSFSESIMAESPYPSRRRVKICPRIKSMIAW